MKGASACVESVFSGVKRLLGGFAATMSPELLELYVFIHYNWQYDFMRPTIDEIVKAYLAEHGHDPKQEDLEPGAESANEDEDEEGARQETRQRVEKTRDSPQISHGRFGELCCVTRNSCIPCYTRPHCCVFCYNCCVFCNCWLLNNISVSLVLCAYIGVAK